MSKNSKKSEITTLMLEMATQSILEKGGLFNSLSNRSEELDYLQQVEESGKQYEQRSRFNTTQGMFVLAHGVENNQQELQDLKKSIKELKHTSDACDSFGQNIKKGQKKHSKKILKLQKQITEHQKELKKYRKQFKEQEKTILFLAAFLNLGSITGGSV